MTPAQRENNKRLQREYRQALYLQLPVLLRRDYYFLARILILFKMYLKPRQSDSETF